MAPTRTAKSRTSAASSPLPTKAGFAPPPIPYSARSSAAPAPAVPKKEASALARKERNRVAAQLSRDRKAQELETLRAENEKLRERIAELESGGGTGSSKSPPAKAGTIETKLKKEIEKLKQDNKKLSRELEEAREEEEIEEEDAVEENVPPKTVLGKGKLKAEEVGTSRSLDGSSILTVADETVVAGLPATVNRGRVFGLFQRMVGIVKPFSRCRTSPFSY
ncbi:hypothetical protein P7C70_g40, partial [Phenoliferia sp. Uapishka_3]